MFQLTPTILLKQKNKAWKLVQGNDGSFQIDLKKENWSLKVHGYINEHLDLNQFQNDPSQLLKEKGRGLNLNLVGKTWKNSGVPLSFCAELGKSEVPMVVPEGCLRFFVGLVIHPFSDGNIYLSAVLKYSKEYQGKETSFLGEFLSLLKQFEFSFPTNSPTLNEPRRINLNLKNTKLERMESYDSGFYSGGGSYSIEESIILYQDYSCHYRYLKVVSLPGLSGGMDQKESRGTWTFDGDFLSLNLWEIQNKKLKVGLLDSGKVLLDGESFWWSKI